MCSVFRADRDTGVILHHLKLQSSLLHFLEEHADKYSAKVRMLLLSVVVLALSAKKQCQKAMHQMITMLLCASNHLNYLYDILSLCLPLSLISCLHMHVITSLFQCGKFQHCLLGLAACE